jgi:tetratricopeptide (TPR) repeat protein
MIGHRLYGMTLFGCGELPAARRHTERALELYDPEQDATLRDIYGFDQRVAALAYLGRTLHQLGFPDQAMRVSEQAVAEARRFDHINTTIYAQGCILELRIMRRETTAIASAAAELARLAQWHAVQNYELVSLTCNYLLALMRDGGAAAVAGIREGIDQLRELNWNYWATRFCLLAAEEAARCHYLADARDWLEQARTLVESLGQRLCTPDLHRVTAVVLDAEHAAPAQVTASLQRAIEVAREQSARWAELRCSTSLAQLLRDQGKPGEALALLSSQLASFSEGTDLPDLVAAAQLLKSLHSAASA